MNRPNIIGREAEITTLKNFLMSQDPEFLAIYGRRRIGKTYLIRSYFENNDDIIFFNTTGSKDAPLQEQIRHFTQHIGETFFGNVTPKLGTNWDTIFKTLTDAIATIDPKKKIVLFLDELPWMATHKSRLLQNLDYYWNQYWSRNNNVKLIVCGSSASWIISNIINNKGGLHNRITRKIQLNPFKLTDTKKFLHSRNIKLNNNQISEIYMLTGGVPYYLSHINKGYSSAQTIEDLAFTKNGLLLNEFNNLFSSLFDNAAPYIELLRIIAQKRSGISQEEISQQAKLSAKGGRISQRLKALKEAGFILAFKPYKHKKRGIFYRVIDEYSLFYLHWIEPIIDTLQEESLEQGYWQGIQTTASWHSWSGYAFEAICFKHLSQIRKTLKIPPTAIASSWRYIPGKAESETGAQIDLLFDKLDNTVTLCEIKYTQSTYTITKQYAKNLENKGNVFSKQTGNQKQQFFAMITANGISNNFYADELITQVITLDDLFEG